VESYDCGNKPLDSINVWEFLASWVTYLRVDHNVWVWKMSSTD